MFLPTVHFNRNLRRAARWVWDEQDAARHFGLKLQEETITEMLLLRLARESIDYGLKVTMFNRHEEGGSKKTGLLGNGADWEWFFDTPYCRVGFRIQAKVLSSGITAGGALSIGKYEGLKKPQQTLDLIRDANNRSFNPVYVFYNHPWVSNRKLFAAPSYRYPVQQGDWGCSVAKADFVKNASGNNLDTLIGGMVPWHRFFGWGRKCLSESTMLEMPGDQKFLYETPEPDWLWMMRDGDDFMQSYLVENRLQGVAHFHMPGSKD